MTWTDVLLFAIGLSCLFGVLAICAVTVVPR
jgi:hypothetical protein